MSICCCCSGRKLVVRGSRIWVFIYLSQSVKIPRDEHYWQIKFWILLLVRLHHNWLVLRFPLNVGAKAPSGWHAAKSQSHAFNHYTISNLPTWTSNSGYSIRTPTLLVSIILSSQSLRRWHNGTIQYCKSVLLILRSYFPFRPPRSL